MWTFLQEINRSGITIILTTHYLEEAEMLCRNIGIIDKGTLVENTSMKRLLAKLSAETFLLDLGSTPQTPMQLEGYPWQMADPKTLMVEVRKEQGLGPLFAQLNHQGVEVLSLRNKSNRLEELFVKLVEQGRG